MELEKNNTEVQINNTRRKSVTDFVQSHFGKILPSRRSSTPADLAQEPSPSLSSSKSTKLLKEDRSRAKSETTFQIMPTGYVSEEFRPALRLMLQEIEPKTPMEASESVNRRDILQKSSTSKSRRSSMSEFLSHRVLFKKQASRSSSPKRSSRSSSPQRNFNELAEDSKFNWEVLLALPEIIGSHGYNADEEKILAEVQFKELPMELCCSSPLSARWDDTKLDAIYQFQDEDGKDAHGRRETVMNFMKWYGAEMRDLLFSKESICIYVQPNMMIGDLKQQIGEKLGVSSEKLCILVSERVLATSDLEVLYKHLCLQNSDALEKNKLPKSKKKAKLTASFYNRVQLDACLKSSCFILSAALKEQIESKLQLVLPPSPIHLVLPETIFSENQTIEDCSLGTERIFGAHGEERLTLNVSVRIRKIQSELRKNILFTQAVLGVFREGLPVQIFPAGAGSDSQSETVWAVLYVSLSKKFHQFKRKLFVPKMTFDKKFCEKVILKCDTFIAPLFACYFIERKKDCSLLPSLLLVDESSGNRIELQALTKQHHKCLEQALNTVKTVFAECLGSDFQYTEGL